MLVAMQFNPANMLTTLRNTMRQKAKLPANPVTFKNPLTQQMQTVYVDALTVETTGVTLTTGQPDPMNQRGVPAFDAQTSMLVPTANLDAVVIIDQPITARLYSIDDLQNAADNGATPGPGLAFTFHLNVEMAVDISTTVPGIVLNLKSVTYNPTGGTPIEIPELEMQFAPYFPIPNQLNFASLNQFLTQVGLIQITRGGIAVSTMGKPTLALELQNPSVGPTPAPGWSWSAFDAPGPAIDLLLGTFDFGVLVDGRLLCDMMTGMVSDGIKDKVDQGHLQIKDQPSASWIFDHVLLSFDGAIVDACAFLFFTHNINFDATVVCTPSVPQAGTFRLDIAGDFHGNWFDDGVCFISAGLFPLNIINAAQNGLLPGGTAALISILQAIGGVLAFISVFTGAAIALGSFDPLADIEKSMPDLHPVKPTPHDSEAYVDYPVKLPTLPAGAGTPSLTSVGGNPIGPVLQGTFFPAVQDLNVPALGIVVDPLDWGTTESCSVDPAVLGGASFYPTGGPNSLTAHINDVQLQDDKHGQFGGFFTFDAYTLTVAIPQASVMQAYLDDPYPCRLMVYTDLGVRLIDLGAFAQITQQQLDSMKLGALVDPNCSGAGSALLSAGPWNPHWLIDPGPQSFPWRIWTITVTDLPTDNVVSVYGSLGPQLGQAVAVGGVAHVSVTEPPFAARARRSAPAAAGFRVERQGRAPKLAAHQRAIRVMQAELHRLCDLVLPAECTSLTLARLRGDALALTVDEFALSVWNFSTPAWPQLLCQVPRRGLRGALLRDGRYLVWGHDGVATYAAPHGRAVPDRETGPRGAILALAPFGSGFVALAADKLMRLDAGLRVVAEGNIQRASDMVQAGKYAIVADSNGLQAFDLTRPGIEPAHTSTERVARLAAARHFGRTAAFSAQMPNGTWQVLAFADDGSLDRLATYPAEPWFAAAELLNPYVVSLSPQRAILSIGVLGQTRRFMT
jgi:hypothetical protein